MQFEIVDSLGGIELNRSYSRMHGGRRQPVIGCDVLRVVVLALAIVAWIAPAHAEERIPVLTRMLARGTEKTRLSAVLALAKLGDPAALKPLITALGDKSFRVREVAATALGQVGCEPALPTLRALAQNDPSAEVRTAASNAVMKIAHHPHGPDDRAAMPDADAQARRASNTGRGAGSKARAIEPDPAEPHPDLYVLINSSTDDSPGSADKPTRQVHADIIKRVLADQCKTEASITSTAGDAQRWKLDARHIDLSVTKLDVANAAGKIEVDAQLRLAVSDDSGKMLSLLSGGAKVQVPSQKFNARYLPALRKEALENAMRGMFDKLLAHLHEHAPAGAAP
jgi:HEAT repeats